jgi:hypothetical protein
MMEKKISVMLMKAIMFLTILIFLIPIPLLAGTTGKIAGKVIDKNSGDPLPGANVVIAGTSMGASTDTNGDYFIINIPPGSYSVTTSFIGYDKLTTSDVRVMVDRTTTVDFALTPSVLEGESVTVIAERPIIEKDVTGSQNILDAGHIDRSPIADIKDAMKQQPGIYYTGETTYMRGGLASEINYILDGTSLNSGLISDNYQRLNITAIEEVSVLTGGYNAEYGEAMSGVVNIITKEASSSTKGIHGTMKYRMRPAGLYHWGRNMYDRSLYKYTYYDTLGYWEARLNSSRQQITYAKYFQRFYGPGTKTNDPYWDGTNVPTAQQLRETYMEQLTPDEILSDYAKRMEHEVEASVYGSLINNITILLSGRYKRGVNIFPQAEPYNPEYNIQGKFSYYLAANKKLTLNLLRGWYKICSFTESNWNNLETSQEARWQPNAEVRHPYWEDTAYAPWGGTWQKGPQQKTFNMGSLKWQHSLSPATFYIVELSYLSDYMTELQDYSRLTTDLATVGWGDSWYDLSGRYRLEARQVRLGNYSDAKVYKAKTDLTSQIHKSHQLKSGADFKLYDLDYQHYWFEFPAGDIWHLDNVFTGKPVELAAYVQDKMEYGGIVLNIGVRVDAFNARTKYPESIYDPLGFQEWNGGDGMHPSNTEPIWQADNKPTDWFAIDSTVSSDYRDFFPDSVRQNKNTVNSEWKVAFAPRIGISFPITVNSKLRFNYGHFYQRPSWSKLMGFPTSWYESDPYGSVRMDQWMGWYGQPGLTYERTIQYELGFAQNILDVLRLDIVAYYKDASRLTRFSYGGTYNYSGGFAQTWYWSPETFSTARNIANDGHDNVFYTNSAYKDMRGIELSIDKLFNRRWSANFTFNYGLTTGSNSGYWQYREDTTSIHQPWGYDEVKLTWLSSYVLKGNINYVTPQAFGPLGLLGDFNIGLYYEFFAGPQYTYYPEGYTGLEVPNNKRWYPHQRTDLKIVKRIPIGDVTPVLGVEVYNLFNNYDRNMLGGDDLEQWKENRRPPQAQDYGGKTEDDIWWFYNSISNPKRMIYVTLSFEF